MFPQLLLMVQNGILQYGTETSKGTKVFALSGKVKYSGLVEVPMGVTLGEIVFNIGGGIPKTEKNLKQYKSADLQADAYPNMLWIHKLITNHKNCWCYDGFRRICCDG